LRGDEGRGWLRKASGSCQPNVDPEISEWGNPLRRTAAVPLSEYIGQEERTRGSETSQYPQEKRTMSDSRSSGERTGTSLNLSHENASGVAGPQ
jgi:hypothetical protein